MIDYTQYMLSRVDTEVKDGLTYTVVLLEGPHPDHGLEDITIKVKESVLKRDIAILESKLSLYNQVLATFSRFVSAEFLQQTMPERVDPIMGQYKTLSRLIAIVEEFKRRNNQ